MKIIVTGSAGFIGSALTLRLLDRKNEVIGIDNHNEYYDPKIKEARAARLRKYSNYHHYKIDICREKSLKKIFNKHKPNKVVNLAAQAGVRYSIENPLAYINSNIVGFTNILENCRYFNIEHLVYASTSSVYGANLKVPFSENDSANHPLSLYAASKKSNELMAHTYSHLYKISTTGLRFFTVYGPWGRPDMALFKFTKAILEKKPIDVYNFGNHTRDFTYIDDIVDGVIKCLDQPAKGNPNWTGKNPDPSSSSDPWRIYNIGNNQPIQLLEYIDALEKNLGIKAEKNLLPMQLGDVPDTYADSNNLQNQFGYKPSTSVYEGVSKFVEWYKNYYNL
ncbi:MAG: capsular biosynthesis protein CpsI [Candidatus Endolissoclinum sp. TMED37]|nr:MAG: capsular biosynthesis protein CpsI [Candidatus Endolissoclinum sp. TMED37]|tara:strand:+ start:1531 stop:2538 length:1008 start_codon:yes stop_codon:yes gene_type:complete